MTPFFQGVFLGLILISCSHLREEPVGESRDSSGVTFRSLAQRGRDIFVESGCSSCHSVSGDVRVGPPLNDLFGTVVSLEGGSTAVADRAYFRESLLFPAQKVVKSFRPLMPSYEGQFSDEQITAIVEYLVDLRYVVPRRKH